jgi:hypothetical protein
MKTRMKKVLGVEKLGSQWRMGNPFIFCAHREDLPVILTEE